MLACSLVVTLMLALSCTCSLLTFANFSFFLLVTQLCSLAHSCLPAHTYVCSVTHALAHKLLCSLICSLTHSCSINHKRMLLFAHLLTIMLA